MSDAKGLTTFEELGLGGVLKRWRLVVPSIQREYAWTNKEVRQLFRDFSKAVSEDSPHFLGTIVTIPRDDGALDVVDGQQRLATIALLLVAVRDYLKEIDESGIALSIDQDFLSMYDRARRMAIPKITLNIDDNDLFSKLITRQPTDELPQGVRTSHERLLSAHDEAKKYVRLLVSTLERKDHGDELNRWLTFFEHGAWVVLLRVSGGSDAYKMFETLNDRGLRTSQVDLIKSFLITKAGKRAAEVQSRWSYMRGALDSFSDAPDITIDFLRHALIVQRGHLIAAEVYDRVQEMVKAETAAVNFASDLENLAAIYVATANPEHERWNSYPDTVRRAIEVFNLFAIKPMRPIVLAVAAKFEKKQTALAFSFLAALGVRLVLASSTRSGSVEEPLARAASKVFSGAVDTAALLKKELHDLTPTDAEFRAAFEVCRVSKSELARYYLRSLEMTVKGDPSPWFIPQNDPQVINLEHVLPTKPGDNWPQFHEDEVALLANRLGNLALMRANDNSELRSKSFAEKKEIYEKSPYELTSQIAEADDWSRQAIADRQWRLAELAVATWPGA